jgi:hypothetical protein
VKSAKEDLMNAIRGPLSRSAVCIMALGLFCALVSPAPLHAATCGDNLAEAPDETCDGTDDSACPGACPGPSDPLACQCPVCGDGVTNQLSETCDTDDAAACPGLCKYDCSCATCGDNVAEGPGETCDGSDDAACPGQCFPPAGVRQCRCPISANKCAAKKQQCVDKYAVYLLKCHMKAELKALGPPDPLCVQKASNKFDGGANPAAGCFEKLETAAAGGCYTNDDTAAQKSAADAFVNAVVTAVDPMYPAPIIDKCSAGKKKCVAKLADALIKCHVKAEVRGLPVDPLCVAKAQVKFDGGAIPAKGCFAKLEAKYLTCQTTNDTAALETLAGDFASSLSCALDPYQGACSTCGNNIAEIPPEDCDGTDDAGCVGQCDSACNCP